MQSGRYTISTRVSETRGVRVFRLRSTSQEIFSPIGRSTLESSATLPRTDLISPQEDFSFLFSEIMLISLRPASAGGACRDRHETWEVGCDGREESQRGLWSRGRTVRCARRNRAVLTPRCWCPAAGVRKRAVARGGQQARCTRETTYKPFQPSRREGRVFSARPVVTAACFFCCRRATGAAGARPSLRPPPDLRADLMHDSGAIRRGRRCRMSASGNSFVLVRGRARQAPHGSRRRCAPPHHEGLAPKPELHLAVSGVLIGRSAMAGTIHRPGTTLAPHPEEPAVGGRLEGRGPDRGGVTKMRQESASPLPRNPLLTGINRTLTNHRAKIAGWNVRVVVGCS